MPPIIEDYSAIKRRMDELANGPKKKASVLVRPSEIGQWSVTFDAASDLPAAWPAFLTPEGQAFMDKHHGT